MHMVLFNTIDIYTAINLNWLSAACVVQWVEHVNIALLYLRCLFESRTGHLFLQILKRLLFLFLLNFLVLQYRFFILINLISLVTTTFSRWIRNTVKVNYRLSSLQFLKYELRHETSNNVAF